MELPIKKPEGEFVRVPTDPTIEMLNAYDEARAATTMTAGETMTYNPHQSYWALLNARPVEDVASPVRGDLQIALDRALARNNELYRMITFLRQRDGECIGDHPSWIAGMDKLLDGEHFDALTELK